MSETVGLQIDQLQGLDVSLEHDLLLSSGGGSQLDSWLLRDFHGDLWESISSDER